jgi:hypothetical protein
MLFQESIALLNGVHVESTLQVYEVGVTFPARVFDVHSPADVSELLTVFGVKQSMRLN